jgi:hypothetical protein
MCEMVKESNMANEPTSVELENGTILKFTNWPRIDAKLLISFMEDYVTRVTICANDIFVPAADAENIDTEDIWKLLEVYEKFGDGGVTAFMNVLNKCEPMKVTNDYLKAKEYLKDFVPFHCTGDKEE